MPKSIFLTRATAAPQSTAKANGLRSAGFVTLGCVSSALLSMCSAGTALHHPPRFLGCRCRTNLSLKLGALYRVSSTWSAYGNYATGFRAPNAHSSMVSLIPLQVLTRGFFPIRPQTETSRNLELGARAQWDQSYVDVAAFTGDYRQLIVDKKFLGLQHRSRPQRFQTVNVDNATIWGFAKSGQRRLGNGRQRTAQYALFLWRRHVAKTMATANP